MSPPSFNYPALLEFLWQGFSIRKNFQSITPQLSIAPIQIGFDALQERVARFVVSETITYPQLNSIHVFKAGFTPAGACTDLR